MGNSPTFLGKYVGCEDQLYVLAGVSDAPPGPVTKQVIQTKIVPKWRNVIWTELVDMADLIGVGPIGSAVTHDQLVTQIAGKWVDKLAEHRAKPKFEPGDLVQIKGNVTAFKSNNKVRVVRVFENGNVEVERTQSILLYHDQIVKVEGF